MTDRIESVSPSPEQVEPNPVQELVETTPVVEQEQEKDPQATGERQLNAMIRSLVKGEKGLRSSYFDAGQSAHEYIIARLKKGEARSAAVTVIQGELSKFSSISINASQFIGATFAHKLLDGDNAFPAVSYTHFSWVYSRLIHRVNPEAPEESYVLLPGFEQQCKDLFTKCSTDSLSREACEKQVKDLCNQWTRERTTQAETAKQEAVKLQSELQTEAETAAQGVKALREALEKAEEDKKAEVQVQLEQAEKDRKDKAELARLATQEVKDATREAKNADSALKRLEKREAASGARQREEPAPLDNLIQNGVSVAKVASPKDLAETIALMIEKSTEPETVLEHVLRRLVKSPEFSPKVKKVLGQACTHLARNDTVIVERNGVAVAIPA